MSEEDITKEYTSKVAKEIDNKMYDFLDENGYTLERGNVQQILDLKEKLAKEDKQVRAESDIVGYKIYDDHLELISHAIFFFDSISHPLKRKYVKEMIVDDYVRRNNVQDKNKDNS